MRPVMQADMAGSFLCVVSIRFFDNCSYISSRFVYLLNCSLLKTSFPGRIIVDYYYGCTLSCSFDKAVDAVKSALAAEGFGILTEIDVKSTLKSKLDVDFYNYLILGACNPPFAYKALTVEDKIGTMLPCNVIVQQKPGCDVEVSAVNPVASMMGIENDELSAIANEIRQKLRNVIDALKA